MSVGRRSQAGAVAAMCQVAARRHCRRRRLPLPRGRAVLAGPLTARAACPAHVPGRQGQAVCAVQRPSPARQRCGLHPGGPKHCVLWLSRRAACPAAVARPFKDWCMVLGWQWQLPCVSATAAADRGCSAEPCTLDRGSYRGALHRPLLCSWAPIPALHRSLLPLARLPAAVQPSSAPAPAGVLL